MLEDATRIEPARHPDRHVVHTRRFDDPWIVVLEPDFDDRLLFVVTAYAREHRQ